MATLFTPYQYFADPTKGRPIFNGFIYIGRPDTDPTNPANQIQVSVICECGGTPINVSQPIRTGPGGLPIYNGSPAQINVPASEYSILLQDRDRVQVYYSPRATGLDSFSAENAVTHRTFEELQNDTNIGRMFARAGDNINRIYTRTATNETDIAAFVDAAGNNWFELTSYNSDSTITHDSLDEIESQFNGGKNYARTSDMPGFLYSTVPSGDSLVTDRSGKQWFLNSVFPTFTNTITINVPTRFPTIRQALDFALYHPVMSGQTVTVNIESGYQIPSGITIENEDLRGVIISSEDDEVMLTDNFPEDDNIFTGIRSFMPTINILIDARKRGSHGIYTTLCHGRVMTTKGIKNAGYFGLYADEASTYVANGTIFTGAGTTTRTDATGISARRCSLIYASSADVSDANNFGISAAITSMVDFTNGTSNNILVRHGIRADEGSFVNANGATITSSKSFSVFALRGSTINARDCVISGINQRGIYAAQGSTINANSSMVSGSTEEGIFALDGSIINVRDTTVSNCDTGIIADNSSTISASGSSSTGNTTVDVLSTRGSNINISQGTAGTVTVNNGSTINASGVTATFSQPVNTITGNGIIFMV